MPSTRQTAHRLGVGLLASIALSLCGCSEPRLPLTEPGAANNVIIGGGIAYASLGTEGMRLVDPASGEILGTLPPPAGTESVDDLAWADDLLFVLDARPPGFLSVLRPTGTRADLVSGPVEAPVSPFTGVAAAAGRVVVSGGTSELTIRAYAADGTLGTELATADAGRGQPDVIIDPIGARIHVSTHFGGEAYGITRYDLNQPPAAPTGTRDLLVRGAGPTYGGARPANFPLQAAVAVDTLYVAHAGGLDVVATALELEPIARLDLALFAVAVTVHGDRAAVLGFGLAPELVLLDLTDRRAPEILTRHPLPFESRPTSVALTDTHAVIAAGSAGVLVVDLSAADAR